MFFGGRNYCSLMLYLTSEYVCENFGGAIARLRDLLPIFVSITYKQELQTSTISSKAINNKILFVFANCFTVKTHHTQGCFTKICQVFVQFMIHFWQKNFENGNVFGSIDFSIFNVFSSDHISFIIHVLSICFNFLS